MSVAAVLLSPYQWRRHATPDHWIHSEFAGFSSADVLQGANQALVDNGFFAESDIHGRDTLS